MSRETEFEGRTEDEAVERASVALGVARAQLDYTVVDEGSGGLFGIGSRPTRIRARSGAGEQGEAVAAPVAAPVASAGPVDAEPRDRDRDRDRGRRGDDGDEEEGGIVGPAPEKAAQARDVAQTLSDKMAMRATVTVRDEEREIVVVLAEAEGSTDVADMLGSSRPPGVPSFQFLLNKIVNRFPENRKHIVVEAPSVAGRVAERRAQAQTQQAQAPRPPRREPPPREPAPPPEDVDPALAAVAHLLAERASLLGKVLTVHPMSAADRRAIHVTILGVDGVETVSEGDGLYRRIHVVPASLTRGGGAGAATGGRRRRRRRRRRGGAEGAEGAPEVGEEGAEGADDGGDEGGDESAPVGVQAES